jgi:hypothetical protein
MQPAGGALQQAPWRSMVATTVHHLQLAGGAQQQAPWRSMVHTVVHHPACMCCNIVCTMEVHGACYSAPCNVPTIHCSLHHGPLWCLKQCNMETASGALQCPPLEVHGACSSALCKLQMLHCNVHHGGPWCMQCNTQQPGGALQCARCSSMVTATLQKATCR